MKVFIVKNRFVNYPNPDLDLVIFKACDFDKVKSRLYIDNTIESAIRKVPLNLHIYYSNRNALIYIRKKKKIEN